MTRLSCCHRLRANIGALKSWGFAAWLLGLAVFRDKPSLRDRGTAHPYFRPTASDAGMTASTCCLYPGDVIIYPRAACVLTGNRVPDTDADGRREQDCQPGFACDLQAARPMLPR